MNLKLIDRVDGCKGHFCISRPLDNDLRYIEYYNKGKWCAFGEVFDGEERAMEVLKSIQIKQAIIVWPFEDAPEEYRKLSPHGGDEDWVAFVPQHLVDKYISWMQNESVFGFDVSEHIVEDGVVRISSH